ncbi:hypothetical protein [Rhodohalobacter halophilus]|uniref:hypothetical protein n=1 Tax=Rhodohalobacter halophilus TaxID=1812810 RepID=UPI00083F7224|nr:hypothetical protein [Rhodohalobacter halophilus]
MIESIHNRVRVLRMQFKEFRESPRGKIILKYLTYAVQVLIIAIIAIQLTGIGWMNIFNSLPTTPWFYLLFLFIYFLLPFSETLAYKITWGIPYWRSISIFIKKRIFNKDVMGYSGEIVLMQWATQHTEKSKKQIFKDVRDMNILSSAASTIIAFGLLGVLFLTGQIKAFDSLIRDDFLSDATVFEYGLILVIVIILIAVITRFRKYLFSMPAGTSAKIFSIHATRMILLYAAQILQWHLVLPDISLEIWFTFLSVNIIISRIPIIPSQDLVATGTNIEIAKILQVPVAPVTGIFLVHDVLGKVLNFILYLFLTVTGKRGKSEITL